MGSVVARMWWAAISPTAITALGLMAFSWSRRYRLQTAFSSALGSRFPGGRHFTVFVMNTSSLVRPASASSPSKTSPASPTKGSPVWSSCSPGASPTSMTSTSWSPRRPGTVFVRDSERRHSSHRAIRSAMASSSGFSWDLLLSSHRPRGVSIERPGPGLGSGGQRGWPCARRLPVKRSAHFRNSFHSSWNDSADASTINRQNSDRSHSRSLVLAAQASAG
jgi:hypothetical protein